MIAFGLSLRIASVLAFGVVAMGAFAATPPTPSAFPTVESADLTGRSLTLPRDLPEARTIMILAFTQEQQADVDGWRAGLGLKPGDTNWLEMPVIDQPGAVGRFFIDTGMRRGIPDVAVRRHVVTLYTDKRTFFAQVGIRSDEQVIVMVVDRGGHILARVDGPFDKDRVRSITVAAQSK